MAYISKDEVKQVRESLKKAFGKRFKFSVIRRDAMCVCVSIMEGDIENWADHIAHNEDYSLLDAHQIQSRKYVRESIRRGHHQINEFYISENWKGEGRKVLEKILECCQVGEGMYNRNAGDMGADYPDYTYFIEINIGKWNKPYTYRPAKLDKVA